MNEKETRIETLLDIDRKLAKHLCDNKREPDWSTEHCINLWNDTDWHKIIMAEVESLQSETNINQKIEALYDELIEPVRSQAIVNHRMYTINPKTESVATTSLANAILFGFEWSATSEGEKYWSNIYENLNNFKKF